MPHADPGAAPAAPRPRRLRRANNPVPGYTLEGLLSRDRQPKAAYEALGRLYRAAAERPQ